jgi:hypothetical protein
VALGGLDVHAALVKSGNVSVPTAPLGALAPAQLLEFDQPELPAGAAPLHAKSVSASADDGSAKTPIASATAAPPHLTIARATVPN